MSLPAKYDDGAEHVLGTTSLQIVRSKIIENIRRYPGMTWWQRRKIINELDSLIEMERCRRKQLAAHQLQRENVEHRLIIAQKQIDIFEKYVDVISRVRLLKARTSRAVARYERDSVMCKLDVIERLMQIRAKHKPAEKQDDHLKELSQIKKQQEVSQAREQAVLDSIAKKAMSRATFINMVNEKFPDMADELVDFYDQQIFQRGAGR
ncbi:MAG: hypothetical protein AB1483_00420 [Candidatus Zixiibacteriota bacterium]